MSQGGLSDAFKKYIAENEVPDNTYDAEGVALFRVQGSGPEDMQAIQIDAVSVLKLPIKKSLLVHKFSTGNAISIWFQQVSTGLNSSHCYILHGDSTVFTWCGNLTTSDDQELMERMLDLIKVLMC